MKAKISVLCFALMCLISCKKNDESISSIVGTWNLIQVNSQVGQSNLDNGDSVWRFDEDILTIENSFANTNEEFSYSLIQHENSFFLNIDNAPDFRLAEYFVQIEISNDKMIIDPTNSRTIIQNDTIPAILFHATIYSFER